MTQSSLLEKLKELSRRESDFFHPFLFSRNDSDSFGDRFPGENPDKFLVGFAFMTGISVYCVSAQGYIRDEPEPFCTIFMISPAGELVSASRDQHMHPGNPNPSEREDWDPFEDGDHEGIKLLHEELIAMVDATITRGEEVSEQVALQMSADTFFRNQSPGRDL